MLLLLLRTVVLYLFLLLTMRLMGKRQLAQLETTELITTLLLSELAALPLENHDIPLLYAIIPILTLVSLEILLSVVLLRLPALRRHDKNTPALLIAQGQLDRDELINNRMTPEELFSALRQQGFADPSEVNYAVLEKNGALSVIPKAAFRPATPSDLGKDVYEPGMMHLLISDGVVHKRTLAQIGRDEAWLVEKCHRRGYATADIYCLMCDDTDHIILIPSDRRGIGRRPWKEDSACAH
ncbi:MAG: DUF421 domain-containing protein [Clostridia bacterium]|nr:DUF421 domain-containing protein [Clostridia bacterium]